MKHVMKSRIKRRFQQQLLQVVDERYDRNIGTWSVAFQEKLGQMTIGLAGLGGSGGCLAEILARNGVGHLKLADYDTFDKSNLQRQINARESTIGMSKAAITAKVVRDINPNVKITLFEKGVTVDNMDEFLDGCDFVHEVVDHSAPRVKVSIHKKCRERGIIVTSAAMAGIGVAVLTFHPDTMTFEEYFSYDENNSSWRQEVIDIFGRYPDYIEQEAFQQRVASGTFPSSADAAFLTGVATAGIYKRFLMGKKIKYAPTLVKIDLVDDAMYEQTLFTR